MMNAVCSSSDLRAKLREDARSIARMPPPFRTTTPSRTSETGTNSCVDFCPAPKFCNVGGIRLNGFELPRPYEWASPLLRGVRGLRRRPRPRALLYQDSKRAHAIYYLKVLGCTLASAVAVLPAAFCLLPFACFHCSRDRAWCVGDSRSRSRARE